MQHAYLRTGQRRCYNVSGKPIPCSGPGPYAGQDAEFLPGLPWPEPRFQPFGPNSGLVRDLATGLVWSRSANPLGFPLTWAEALAEVARLNTTKHLERTDWRLPNRRELRSLIDHSARQPALPAGHPFTNVFSGWVWTSTTSAMAPAYAWRVHLEGGRMFYGAKTDASLIWPVAGSSAVLPATGQTRCYEPSGAEFPCGPATGRPNESGLAHLSGQDGQLRAGLPWPEPRFEAVADGVLDRLTNLIWTQSADLAPGLVDWPAALKAAHGAGPDFRLPTINELESLVDASAHSPALPGGHPFLHVPEAVWSSTTSGFEPDWAFCLYFHKGAVGVGFKAKPEFAVWAVRSAPA